MTSYLSTVLLFPTILVSTAMGVLNLFARIATIMAPVVAEVKSPIDLVILLIICSIAFVASQFIVLP